MNEGVSKMSKQMNEWAVQANKQTDKRVAQYLYLGSWLICPTVQWKKEPEDYAQN